MLAVYETAAGLAIVELLNKSLIKDAQSMEKAFKDQPVSNLVSLKNFIAYESTEESMKAMHKLNKGKLVKKLKKNLKSIAKSVDKPDDTTFATIDSKLAKAIQKKVKVNCICDDSSSELLRFISQNFAEISAEKAKEISIAELGLAHNVARHTLQFSTDKVDTMVIQAVNLLDTVDKELNGCTQRVKEWYGWHFPELIKIIEEPLDYVAAVQKIGNRANFIAGGMKDEDPRLQSLKAVINNDEKFEAISQAIQTSIGLDITAEDEETVAKICHEALELAQYRLQLSSYLKQRMANICPNMSKILGDHCGAKLLAHAGSLSNLAKKAGSTVQILGSEKALFQAIKRKGKTPKYGILYGAPLVNQTPREHKGKICRSVAAKAALAARVDYNQEVKDGSFGENMRQKLDVRFKKISNKAKKNFNDRAQRPHQPKQQSNFSGKRTYNSRMDATEQPSSKRTSQ